MTRQFNVYSQGTFLVSSHDKQFISYLFLSDITKDRTLEIFLLYEGEKTLVCKYVNRTTGLTRSVSLENLYKKCGWATLSQRRQQHKLSFMYNVNSGMVPSYIQDLIIPLVSEISDYPLRNNRNISIPLNRTSFSQKSCIPSAIRLWNSLDDILKDISTLPTFKRHIFSKLSIAHVPPNFTVGNRYMSVLHARLRNKWSGLNSDLFRNHIHNNPLCDWCDVVEDAYHYFFQCRKYTVERQVFNDTVRGFHPLHINVILNGNEN